MSTTVSTPTSIDGALIEHGDTIEFTYLGGSAPGALRQMQVKEIYDDGGVGGEEKLIAGGEYRRFKPHLMYDVTVIESEELITLQMPIKESERLLLIATLENLLKNLKKEY